MNRSVYRRRERGATIVTTALLMLFLLGFIGIALDFGRLFIVKSELQTAMDSCALAAAQELDGQPDALTRAVNAGLAAGNLNRVDLQSATWRGAGQLTANDITFKNNGYMETSDAAQATYVQCRHTQAGVQMWLMQALGAFSGSPELTPGTQNVLALAEARRAPGQTACPLPVAVRPKGPPPNYGYTPGDWLTLIHTQSSSSGGEIGWANLDGSNSASETEAEMNGKCGVAVDDPLGTPGVQASIVDAWNYRFGIYKNSVTLSMDDPTKHPDLTGYAYTATNWPSRRNAYEGTPGASAPVSAENFVMKRTKFASCADTGTRVKGANSCESITGLTINGGFQKLALPGNVAGGHKTYGRNRRIVTVPVINSDSRVEDFVCMLMLQPLSIPMTDVQLEFLGNASDENSPCATAGLPGGLAGPLVPVLVR